MTFIRASIATALAAGAWAWAAPAAADSDVFGTYTFTAKDGENATWTMLPCADNAAGCVRVSETGNAKRGPWSGDAHWSVGSLILVVQQPDAVLCPDGTSAPGSNTYSWDGSSLSGSASLITNGACGEKSASVSIPFQLARLGAAEAQVPPAAPAAVPAPPSAVPAPPPAVPAPPAVPGPPAAPASPPGPPQPAPDPIAPLAAESTAGPAGAPPAPAG